MSLARRDLSERPTSMIHDSFKRPRSALAGLSGNAVRPMISAQDLGARKKKGSSCYMLALCPRAASTPSGGNVCANM